MAAPAKIPAQIHLRSRSSTASRRPARLRPRGRQLAEAEAAGRQRGYARGRARRRTVEAGKPPHARTHRDRPTHARRRAGSVAHGIGCGRSSWRWPPRASSPTPRASASRKHRAGRARCSAREVEATPHLALRAAPATSCERRASARRDRRADGFAGRLIVLGDPDLRPPPSCSTGATAASIDRRRGRPRRRLEARSPPKACTPTVLAEADAEPIEENRPNG